MGLPPTRNEMLRDVMKHAFGSGYAYRGLGHMWGWMRDEDREKVLASGEYIEVLRSEEFCRAFWRIDLVFGTYIGPSPPTDLIVNEVTDEQITAWARHHEALKTAADPLVYCYENMP